MQPPTYTRLLILLALFVLLPPSPVWSHTHLRRSEPAKGARLVEVPRELRLHFSESVGLALTRVTLLGPNGVEVALGKPVQVADSAQVVVVRIEGRLSAGAYQVVWQTAGRDGHPIRGRYEFTVVEGATGAVAPDAGKGAAIPGRGAVAGGANGGAGIGSGGGQGPHTSPGDVRSGAAASAAHPPGAPNLPATSHPGDAVPATEPAAGDLAGGAPGAASSGVPRGIGTPSVSGVPGGNGVPGGSGVPGGIGTTGIPGIPGAPGTPGFSAESPLYALVRFLLFVGLFGVIGAVAFRLLVVARVVRRGKGVGYTLAEEIGVRPARVGAWFSGLLGVGLVMRLVAQGYALGGGIFDGGALRAQLAGTVWGWGWVAQGVGVVLAWSGFRWSSRGRLGGWGVAGVGVLLLGLTTGLSGHAAGLASGAALALAADAGHVLGAGGWLGGLLLLVGIGLPAALRVDERWSGAAVVELVNAFSGLALCCAGVVVLTGGIGTLLHVGSLANLVGTGYGRTLVLKLAIIGVVLGMGAYNYLRVRPVVGEALGARRLRAASTIELVAGVVVLVVTAVLVALPTP